MDELNKENLPIQRIQDTESYSKYYDENRFWRKMRRISQKAGLNVLRPVLTLYYMMKSNNVPLREKAYIVGALGYFILPVDLIPDFLAGLGYTDDIAVITLLLKHLKDNVSPEIEARVNAKIRDLTE